MEVCDPLLYPCAEIEGYFVVYKVRVVPDWGEYTGL